MNDEATMTDFDRYEAQYRVIKDNLLLLLVQGRIAADGEERLRVLEVAHASGAALPPVDHDDWRHSRTELTIDVTGWSSEDVILLEAMANRLAQ